jgi:hypothetical protein
LEIENLTSECMRHGNGIEKKSQKKKKKKNSKTQIVPMDINVQTRSVPSCCKPCNYHSLKQSQKESETNNRDQISEIVIRIRI